MVGDRLNFMLVNPMEITFYMYIEKVYGVNTCDLRVVCAFHVYVCFVFGRMLIVKRTYYLGLRLLMFV